ncbi:HD domain-containing protein, partial [Butyriboletus roseoflavus]
MSTTKPAFPPLYQPTGDPDTDRLAFFHVLERLKTQKRTGWIDHNVPNPESISDHMYRMAVLAMCTSDATLDVSKCVMMCVVHDLAEAQVGDITPRERIPKGEKRRLEAEAMYNFVHDMLHASPAALRIEALWKEYEEGVTPEAKFVKGTFGQTRDGTARGFFDSSLPHLQHPEIRHWGDTLALTRVNGSAVDGRGGVRV